MSNLDIYLYHIALAAILLTACAYRFLGLTIRSFPLLQYLFFRDHTKDKEQRSGRTKSALSLSSGDFGPIVEKESKFSTSWWTSNDVFQLERRAIFSKVGLALNIQRVWH
jgi:hypothetical protein